MLVVFVRLVSNSFHAQFNKTKTNNNPSDDDIILVNQWVAFYNQICVKSLNNPFEFEVFSNTILILDFARWTWFTY